MIEQLTELLAGHGIELGAHAEELKVYHDLLLQWNTKMDLTNVAPEEMALRHYADSLVPLKNASWFARGTSMIDVGTGAGFPGMAIGIMRPDMKILLLDSLKKRCDFLSAVVDELGLKNITVLHARAEDAARDKWRGSFDISAARAVAPMRVLIEYLLPFVKVGGQALCWKGPGLDEELSELKSALFLLKGRLGERMLLDLPGFEHSVQAVIKTAPTPAPYPRKAGLPKKDPL